MTMMSTVSLGVTKRVSHCAGGQRSLFHLTLNWCEPVGVVKHIEGIWNENGEEFLDRCGLRILAQNGSWNYVLGGLPIS